MRKHSSHVLAAKASEGEFLWLVSLSDLMILLFVFFVVLFSFAYQKLSADDLARIAQKLSGTEEEAGTPLDETQKRLLNWIMDRKLINDVQIERKRDALILQIREKVLFASGSAVVGAQGQGILNLMAEALKQIPAPYRIGIEGHTDDVASAQNPMLNWDLSSRRAVAVLQTLNLGAEQLQRTVVMGYADQRPIAPNRDEKGNPVRENQDRNRRVTIRIF